MPTDNILQARPVPYRSHPTHQDALVLALRYAHSFGMTTATISRNYDLRRSTLAKISRGEVISRNREWFYDNLILALNDCRLRALNSNDTALVTDISHALMDVCLVNSGIATDEEIFRKSRFSSLS